MDLAFHEKATALGGAGLRIPSCENDDNDDEDDDVDEVLGLTTTVFADEATGNAPRLTLEMLSNRSISGRTAIEALPLLLLLLLLLNPNECDADLWLAAPDAASTVCDDCVNSMEGSM